MKPHLPLGVVAAFAGCFVPSKEPGVPALDEGAPRVEIVSPARGTIAGDVTRVRVAGTASDDSGVVASVTVNGVTASLAADGAWVAEVDVAPGTTLLHAIALDAEGKQGTQTRAVVAGPMVTLDRYVADGIRATLSAQALSALGRSTATFVESSGLMAGVQGANPVVNVGDGPDCLYAQASITSLTVGDADVLMGPTTGGILISAVLDDVRIGTQLSWAVTCLDGSRDVELTAQRVTVQGLLAVDVVERSLAIQFANPSVQVTGFDPQLPGIPDVVVQMLALDSAVSGIFASVTERVAVPIVEQALTALDDTKTIDIAGTQIGVDVEPTQISFTPEGGRITLDTSLRAAGDNGELVFVPNLDPPLDADHGFGVAVADDVANQLLTSLWSAKGFDATIDLQRSSDGDIADHYDSVRLELVVPPHVDGTSDPLELTIGDWIATFERDEVPAATVAIHAKSAIDVVVGDDGTLRMDVRTPRLDMDMLAGGESITKPEYEAIRAFATERVDMLGSAALAAVPLPAVGGLMPTSPRVDPGAGYLLIVGNVE